MDEQVYRRLRAPTTLGSRYLTEDVSLGLEVFVELAIGLDLGMPITESVVRMARVLISHMENSDDARGQRNARRLSARPTTCRAALLVVDMANDFGHPNGAYSWHGLRCRPLDMMIVPVVAQLIAAAKAGSLPVILCSQVIYTTSDGTAIASTGLIGAWPWLLHDGRRRGTWGTSMLDGLPEPDIVVEKARASGFHATPLDLILRRINVETIVVVGGFTNQPMRRDNLSLWRPVTPQGPDDQDGRFFESALIAQPGYDDQPAEQAGPSRESSRAVTRSAGVTTTRQRPLLTDSTGIG